ncbi:MAG: YlxR family protein [Lachnospiraceae bacterium]|nr:YlxR family protein [Lachnospiraceae bacterium]MCH4030646.1 YlxR family protein [Lachnospiraceae bacterium]MCH4069855.1 YlxR family protein [Lachnospiraceae bacterium]MCH4107206.1 YlxR family protein [Lachnospiraceae bacterium]MCI1301939.1 YlxR family protein [Lachnospiraceae bacterium]
MAEKKIPMRQCVGCRTAKPKKELIRIVRLEDGTFALDPTGRKNGRGAYICRDPQCLKKAKMTGGLNKAFRENVPPRVYEELGEELEKLEQH